MVNTLNETSQKDLPKIDKDFNFNFEEQKMKPNFVFGASENTVENTFNRPQSNPGEILGSSQNKNEQEETQLKTFSSEKINIRPQSEERNLEDEDFQNKRRSKETGEEDIDLKKRRVPGLKNLFIYFYFSLNFFQKKKKIRE